MKNGIASVRCRFNYLSDKHKDQRFQILITPSMVTNNGKYNTKSEGERASRIWKAL